MKVENKYIEIFNRRALFALLILIIANFALLSQYAYAEDAKKNAKIKNKIDDDDFFTKVDTEPQIDLKRLSQLVVYPELARRAGVEGRVVVRVLVDIEGNITKTLIEHSDNRLLDQAAINAVKNYGRVQPAYLDGKPTMCWISIPIKFKLKDNKPLTTKDYLNGIKRIVGFLLFKN